MTANAIFNYLYSPGNLQYIISGAFTDSQWFKIQGYEFWEQIKSEYDNSITESYKIAMNLMHNGYVAIVDTEESKLYALTIDMIKQGWIKLICEYPTEYARIVTGKADIYDYDKLIQLSIFNKLIYG